jgi:hypothetical protein
MPKASKGGRPRSEVYAEFGEPYSHPNFKLKRRDCNHCKKRCTDSAQKLKEHWSICEKTDTGIGMMMNGYIPPTNLKDEADAVQLVHKPMQRWCDSMTTSNQEKSDKLLAKAMHRQAVPYSFFDTQLWRQFFTSLRPSYHLPCPARIGGELMNQEYINVQTEALQRIKSFRTICITIDGATMLTGKQVLNAMACGPQSFFLEHFTMDLQKESADNLLDKVLALKTRLKIALSPPS